MADTTTSNYLWVKPEVGASASTWGTKMNANLDSIDATLKAVSVLANTAVSPSGNGHSAPLKTTIVDADELWGADSAASFSLFRITWAKMRSYIYSAFNLVNDGAPLDADRIYYGDSASSFSVVYSTLTQFKAFLKTYFDTVYAQLAHTHTFASLTSKPTTVAGFGITDVGHQAFDGELVGTWDGTGGLAQLDFTGLANYQKLRIIGSDLTMSGSSALLVRVSTDNGATYVATGYLARYSFDSSIQSLTSAFGLGGFGSTDSLVFDLDMFNVNIPTVGSGVTDNGYYKAGGRAPSGVNNALRLLMSGGQTFTGGKIRILGWRTPT